MDTEVGHQVAAMLKELVEFSPPDVLTTAWDQRRNRYFAGQAAMAYGWGARFGESLLGPQGEELAVVTGVIAPPTLNAETQAVPLGSWNFGIPTNVKPESLPRAQRILAAICGELDRANSLCAVMPASGYRLIRR